MFNLERTKKNLRNDLAVVLKEKDANDSHLIKLLQLKVPVWEETEIKNDFLDLHDKLDDRLLKRFTCLRRKIRICDWLLDCESYCRKLFPKNSGDK